MDQFARIVLGYHGAKAGDSAAYANSLLMGEVNVANWKLSTNDYDWLGDGIYFWEHSFERAQDWAGPDGVVIGAVIQLGKCLDLTDRQSTQLLRTTYDELATAYQTRGWSLPRNGGRDLKLRRLDCLVINNLCTKLKEVDVVRGAFEEGEEAFPGSALKIETHIQIAVRKWTCILGIFRPTLTMHPQKNQDGDQS